MSPDLAIRKAASADIDRLAPLFDAYRRFYGRPSDPALARRFITERLRREESVIFLALAAREIVGFVQLYPSFDSVEARPVWILHDLFVSPHARGAGAGRALMEAAAGLARETGACGLSLATAVDNTVAQGLYETLGYVQDRRFFHYFLPLEPQDEHGHD